MRSISIVINARLSSSRLPNKLIKPFCGSTLIELALSKLSSIKCSGKYLAAYDPEIIELYKPFSKDIALLDRDPESVAKGMVSHKVAFKHYGNVTDEYIMVMNPCHPFAKISVYEKAMNQFMYGSSESMTSVVKKTNIFFNENHTVVNSSSGTEIQTHKQEPLYEMAHVFHIINRSRFIEQNALMWEYKHKDPELFVVDKLSALDVDEELDFKMCQHFGKEIFKNKADT